MRRGLEQALRQQVDLAERLLERWAPACAGIVHAVDNVGLAIAGG
jgi:hypothetical protein